MADRTGQDAGDLDLRVRLGVGEPQAEQRAALLDEFHPARGQLGLPVVAGERIRSRNSASTATGSPIRTDACANSRVVVPISRSPSYPDSSHAISSTTHV